MLRPDRGASRSPLPGSFSAALHVAAHGLDPTAAAPLYGTGTIAWDTNHPRTPAGFWAEVTGREYSAGDRLVHAFNIRNYAGAASFWVRSASGQLALVTLVLAAIGAGALVLRETWAAAIILAPIAGLTIFTFSYMTDPHDFARYLLPSFALVAALAAATVRVPAGPLPARVLSAIVAAALAAGAVNTGYATAT